MTIWYNDLTNVVAFAGFAALGAMWHRMRWEVNRALPADSRFGWLQWPWESIRIYSVHNEHFPDSKLRLAHNIVLALWAPFGVLGFWRLHQAIHGWLAR